MNLRMYWEVFRQYWRQKTASYVHDFRRLDAASRPTAVGVAMLGIVMGMVPLAAMIVVFRLVDAVTGARAVRVLTSDLHKGLVTLAVVWLIAVAAWVLTRWLQGLTRKMAERTAVIVFTGSVLVAVLTLAPFRAVLVAVNFSVLHPWMHSRRVRVVCVTVHALLSYSLLSTVTSFLLSRSITVGSYVLFLGAIFGAMTMTLVYTLRPRNV